MIDDMRYKVIDAFRIKNQTVIALDKKRDVEDLSAKFLVCNSGSYPITWIQPTEFVSIQFPRDPEELIGQTIGFTMQERVFLLKILDEYMVAGKKLYLLEWKEGYSNIKLMDILYDKDGFRFQVSEIAMVTIKTDYSDQNDYILPLRLKPLDGEDVHGQHLTNLPKMTKQEICDFICTDEEFYVDGRHCAICPFEDITLITNGIDEFAFDSLEEAIEAPIFDGESIIDLWIVIYPQIS